MLALDFLFPASHRKPQAVSTIPKPIEPIISLSEARKILGLAAKDVADEELREILLQQEQIIRFIFRNYRVRKNTMVK